ncbi:MAG TPA: hypothetical protein DCX95_00260 [Elusimicrobia bacterium]|nr:hypothetical protein [Elusimicrobiota bacterium]
MFLSCGIQGRFWYPKRISAFADFHRATKRSLSPVFPMSLQTLFKISHRIRRGGQNFTEFQTEADQGSATTNEKAKNFGLFTGMSF